MAAVAVLAALTAHGCGGDDDDGAVERLHILVTNDDGVAAEGIDAVVEALAADPANEVVVAAPNGNRSGSGDNMGPSDRCGDLGVAAATTLSGYAATAVDGCPADAVLYGLDELYPAGSPPHVVVSGINEGQNVSSLVATQLSGTVGAAKTAARQGVPAVALSQGNPAAGDEYDYPAGVAAMLDWIEENRNALLDRSMVPVDVENINVPSCSDGQVRGTLVDVPLAEEGAGFFDPQDCTSDLTDPADDVEALNNGFVTRSKVPLD